MPALPRGSMNVAMAAGLALATPAILAQAPDAAIAAQQWQAVATADLDAVRTIIAAAHPGAIDEQNPQFQQWNKTGYARAQALIVRVTDYDSAIAAVRSYVTGFRDGHFVYSEHARKPHYETSSNGVGIELTEGRYLVHATLPNWPVPLPPVGAELLSCDGLTPQQLAEQRYEPYFTRRTPASDAQANASRLHTRVFADDELKRCVYRTREGKTLSRNLVYRRFQAKVYSSQVQSLLYKDAGPGGMRRVNRYTFDDGVLWIAAANFDLQAGTSHAADLHQMLAEIAALQGVRQIIFDTRGNKGGDSRIGDLIFDAATGGLVYDTSNLSALPRTYAQWRVSDIAIATFAEHADKMSNVYGADSKQALDAKDELKQMQEAKAVGETWLRQDDGYRVTPADIARRGGHLKRFKGQVVLLTDHNCASACLDFADIVRSVPGSLHVGQTTSSDTVYIDTGRIKLPSGNKLVLPLKVWRNRLRGNNEPWIPQVPLNVDMLDDTAVRQAVLVALAAPAPLAAQGGD